MKKMPKYVIIVSSGCQLYSGTGRVIFDWIIYSKKFFDYEFVIDSRDHRNYIIARTFCIEQEIPLTTMRSYNVEGLIDNVLVELEDFLQKKRPDFVEVHSWANVGLNLAAVDALAGVGKLLFTPHYQPLWTLPDPDRYFMIEAGLRQVLEESDCVFCLSPVEVGKLEELGASVDNLHLIYNGVNTEAFTPHAPRLTSKRPVFSLFDFNEPRKRGDLLIAALSRAVEIDQTLHIALAGRGSGVQELPGPLAQVTALEGYLSQSELLDIYFNASLFVLLSDFEAFGIPIAEALCCGVPVVINDTPEMRSIFGDLPGVSIVRNTDTDAVAHEIVRMANGAHDRSLIAESARNRFALSKVYGKKLEIILNLQ